MQYIEDESEEEAALCDFVTGCWGGPTVWFSGNLVALFLIFFSFEIVHLKFVMFVSICFKKHMFGRRSTININL